MAWFDCRIPISDNHVAIQVPFSPSAVVLPPTNYCPFVALHQGFKATIPNYLKMELRYMDSRGMRLKNIQAGP